MSGLHTVSLGDDGPLVAFCHGLFGQGKNWTSIGRQLADRHRVLLVDMPHHGRSTKPEAFDYLDAADRVAALFDAEDPVALVGHSMGGKVAMLVALRHPEKVERLCVVDMAPVAYPTSSSEFAGYIEAMQAIDLEALGSRAEADEALGEAVPNRTVRGFLLQNLRRSDGGWSWMADLEVLGRDLAQLGEWPEDALADVAAYEGPVLWIGGETSDYVRAEHVEAMTRWFPRARRVTVKGAGHWVHSEQPEVFTAVLGRFLDGERG